MAWQAWVFHFLLFRGNPPAAATGLRVGRKRNLRSRYFLKVSVQRLKK